MKCVPDVATRKVDKRVYSSACFNMCYTKCGHGGCGDSGDPCDADGCHKCGHHVYTHKYLVLHICPKEFRVNTCKPVPATCEGPCPPAPCEMPVAGAFATPGMQAAPMPPPPYLAVPPGR
jgi:hypothetical protein